MCLSNGEIEVETQRPIGLFSCHPLMLAGQSYEKASISPVVLSVEAVQPPCDVLRPGVPALLSAVD